MGATFKFSCKKNSATIEQPRKENRKEPGQPRPPSEKVGCRCQNLDSPGHPVRRPGAGRSPPPCRWDTPDHPDIDPGPPQRQETPFSVHSLSATSGGRREEDSDRKGKAENRGTIYPSVHVPDLLKAVTPPHQAHRLANASAMILTTFQKSGLNTMVSTAATKLGSVGSTYPSSQFITKRSACKDRIAISRRPV